MKYWHNGLEELMGLCIEFKLGISLWNIVLSANNAVLLFERDKFVLPNQAQNNLASIAMTQFLVLYFFSTETIIRIQ